MIDFVSTARHVHDEYVRRNLRSPEPLKQPQGGLRRAVGRSLIAIGERLAMSEGRSSLDKAAWNPPN